MTPQEQWLVTVYQEAKAARHVWPDYAACEAANESDWGKSKLTVDANNLFGTKQHTHPIYGTLNLSTHEYLHKEWVVVNALWVKYPTLQACFEDRMNTLVRLSHTYPHYAAALRARNGVTFVDQVSASWSTDPDRAHKVLAIYNAHGHLLKQSVAP